MPPTYSGWRAGTPLARFVVCQAVLRNNVGPVGHHFWGHYRGLIHAGTKLPSCAKPAGRAKTQTRAGVVARPFHIGDIAADHSPSPVVDPGLFAAQAEVYVRSFSWAAYFAEQERLWQSEGECAAPIQTLEPAPPQQPVCLEQPAQKGPMIGDLLGPVEFGGNGGHRTVGFGQDSPDLVNLFGDPSGSSVAIPTGAWDSGEAGVNPEAGANTCFRWVNPFAVEASNIAGPSFSLDGDICIDPSLLKLPTMARDDGPALSVSPPTDIQDMSHPDMDTRDPASTSSLAWGDLARPWASLTTYDEFPPAPLDGPSPQIGQLPTEQALPDARPRASKRKALGEIDRNTISLDDGQLHATPERRVKRRLNLTSGAHTAPTRS